MKCKLENLQRQQTTLDYHMIFAKHFSTTTSKMLRGCVLCPCKRPNGNVHPVTASWPSVQENGSSTQDIDQGHCHLSQSSACFSPDLQEESAIIWSFRMMRREVYSRQYDRFAMIVIWEIVLWANDGVCLESAHHRKQDDNYMVETRGTRSEFPTSGLQYMVDNSEYIISLLKY